MSLLNLLQRGVTVTTNTRPSNPNEGPQVEVNTTNGQLQVNGAAAKQLGIGAGDFLANAAVDRMFNEVIEDLPITCKDKTFIVFAGGKSETHQLGAALAAQGNDLQCSSANVWNELGGNSETKQIYGLSVPTYGFAVAGDVAFLVTDETSDDVVVDGVLVVSDGLDKNKLMVTVGTIAEAKQAKPFAILSFKEAVAKMQRKAPTTPRKSKKGAAVVEGAAPVVID